MDPFDERDTISAPISDYQSKASLRRDPIVALRFLGSRREIELDSEQRRLSVGASSSCDVVIDDPYASAQHCVLEQRAPGYLILRDHRSKNGTMLNGNLVEQAALRPGALVTIGRTQLVAVGRRNRHALTAFERLRGMAPAFRDAVDLAIRAAEGDCSVLILGETGTGKELVARAIHDASLRSGARFVALNCGAIPADLIGSELFGHLKGAFTGAVNDREGVFARANGGTLFLDELAELPGEQQPHLLRVLETQRVMPLGGDREEPVDVRLVAATNRSQALGTSASPLRVDLYHRIATVVVELPPLRDRAGDVPILARSFLDDLAPRYGRRTISRRTMAALSAYSWPGNVRELRNAIHRAVTLCPGELALDKLLPRCSRVAEPAPVSPPASVRRGESRPALAEGSSDGASSPGDGLAAASRDLILDTLEAHGSIRRAAEVLGIPKSTLADRARRLGIGLVEPQKYGVVGGSRKP